MYLNTILYGVAGTGKTYNTVIYAVAIVENKSIEEISQQPYDDVLKRFNQYRGESLIEMVTFHQSYSYEEFVEGIKPILNHRDIAYTLEDGTFKRFCRNQSAWDFLIGQDVSSKNARKNKFIVDNITSENIIIKKVKLGSDELPKFITIPIDMVKDLITAIKNGDITIQDLKNFNGDNDNIHYDDFVIKLYKDIIYQLVENILLHKDVLQVRNKVFIIDEINRGNISKIFGELITLIEPSKRVGNLEELKVRLPYSKDIFGIPNNIHILGTMNSSDHSTISLDTALRRRFHFVEMLPNYDLFKNLNIEGINVEFMFRNLNLRIEYLSSKDNLIGHTYFLQLIKNPSIESLSNIFRYTIIPLLCEYFYNDFEKVRLILADDQTEVKENQFIVKKSMPKGLFKNGDLYLNPVYSINIDAFKRAESYLKI
ncbi:MAG: McrB family protein [Oscillospiraceae bacterium]